MPNSIEIYLVEIYWEDYINEDTIRIPLMAFETLPDAEEYCDKCSAEKQRIQTELKAYWDKHQAERDRLVKSQREKLLNGTYVKGNDEELRTQEIFKGSKAIEDSHEYHDLPIYQDMDLTYESTPIDYVSQ